MPPAKIDVVPLAADPGAPATATPSPSCASGSSSATRPVVLAVSAKRPHKNLPRLLKAMAGLAPERRPITGDPGLPDPARAGALAACAAALGIDDGPADAGVDVRARTSRASTAWPRRRSSPRSTRASGCRCSRRCDAGCRWPARTRSSLPEVAGDAALLFDPEDVGAIAARPEPAAGRRRTWPARLQRGRRRAGGAVHAGGDTRSGRSASYRRALGSGVGRAPRAPARRRATAASALRAEPGRGRARAGPCRPRARARSRRPGRRRVDARPRSRCRRARSARRPRCRAPATTTLGTAQRGPPRPRPARSPPGATAAPCSARSRQRGLASPARHEPGRADDLLRAACRRSASSTAPRSGPSPKITHRAARAPAATPRDGGGHDAGDPLLRDVPAGEHHERRASGLAGPRLRRARELALEDGRLAPRAAGPQALGGAARRSRTRAGGPAGTAAARPSRPAAERPQVLAPVLARSRPRASRRRSEPVQRPGRRRRQQGEVGKRGRVDHVVAAPACRADGAAPRAPKRSGGQILRRPAAV